MKTRSPASPGLYAPTGSYAPDARFNTKTAVGQYSLGIVSDVHMARGTPSLKLAHVNSNSNSRGPSCGTFTQCHWVVVGFCAMYLLIDAVAVLRYHAKKYLNWFRTIRGTKVPRTPPTGEPNGEPNGEPRFPAPLLPGNQGSPHPSDRGTKVPRTKKRGTQGPRTGHACPPTRFSKAGE